jgi:hypothetical protein
MLDWGWRGLMAQNQTQKRRSGKDASCPVTARPNLLTQVVVFERATESPVYVAMGVGRVSPPERYGYNRETIASRVWLRTGLSNVSEAADWQEPHRSLHDAARRRKPLLTRSQSSRSRFAESSDRSESMD